MVAFNIADLDEGSFKYCRLVKESWSVPRQKQKEKMISERTTGRPSSRLEKKQTIDSWKHHLLSDSVLIYERNR